MTTPAVPTMPVPEPKNLLSQAVLSSSPANNYDLNAATGTPQAPATATVDDKSMVANQIQGLLSSGSPWVQLARTRAAQAANSRGLLNSSIAAGAGETAAIEAALPIAQADASTNSQYGLFNAEQRNLFNRDQNNFMREGALAKMNNAAQMERMGWEAGLNERTSAIDANRRMTEMGYQAAVNAEQATADFNRRLEEMGYANKLQLANVPINYAMSVSSATQQQVANILQDPNLSPDAKKVAIKNVVDYANATMGWAEQFFGVNSITRLPTGMESTVTSPLATAAPAAPAAPVAPAAPAPAPAPVAAPAPKPAPLVIGQWPINYENVSPGGF